MRRMRVRRRVQTEEISLAKIAKTPRKKEEFGRRDSEFMISESFLFFLRVLAILARVISYLFFSSAIPVRDCPFHFPFKSVHPTREGLQSASL